jgi:hypothetical protein
MRDTWRKPDLSEMKIDGPPFSKTYFYPTLPYTQNNNSNKVDSREQAYHLPSILGQTRALDMQFL